MPRAKSKNAAKRTDGAEGDLRNLHAITLGLDEQGRIRCDELFAGMESMELSFALFQSTSNLSRGEQQELLTLLERLRTGFVAGQKPVLMAWWAKPRRATDDPFDVAAITLVLKAWLRNGGELTAEGIRHESAWIGSGPPERANAEQWLRTLATRTWGLRVDDDPCANKDMPDRDPKPETPKEPTADTPSELDELRLPAVSVQARLDATETAIAAKREEIRKLIEDTIRSIGRPHIETLAEGQRLAANMSNFVRKHGFRFVGPKGMHGFISFNARMSSPPGGFVLRDRERGSENVTFALTELRIEPHEGRKLRSTFRKRK
jgi:hypothetical protein